MKKSSYREPDYTFGKLMLTLRTATGLTQAALSDYLGVSRNAIGGWEMGQSYPKAEHLKTFILLCLHQQVWASGREEEEIRTLWRAAHQKVLLDELWLHELLSERTPSPEHNAAEPSSVPSGELALWMVPYARNPHFTGRSELLDQLTAQLASPIRGQTTTIRHAALTQAQVIKGLGGIGKTQTAVEYAYRAREQGRYTHTFWIAAASEEALLTSFTAMSEQLPSFAAKGESRSQKLVAAVIHWLEQCQEPWLLIVDNADDLAMVQPYLPLKGNGSVLLTTRASAASWLASSVEVDAMGILEGVELLLRRAQRFAHASDDDINEAANLVVALAQFPLALDQAGAYIEETGCSVTDYYQLYQTHRLDLLSRRGRQATGYPVPVATTWELSLRQVEVTNPAAIELLRLCAFLAPDGIPEELLNQGAAYWPSALQEAVADRFRFNQMLETLLAFSLVKRLPEDRLLSIHRLVQAVQVERLTTAEQRLWAERIVCAMNGVFPRESQDAASWQACSRYLDQVQVCDQLIQHHQLLLPEAAEMLDRAGTYLSGRALYNLAEPLYRQAIHIWKQLMDEAHPNVAASRNNLARLYVAQGEYAAAESLFQQVLHTIEQLVEAEHLPLVEALRGLGQIYTNQGKYAQAIPLLQRAILLGEQQAGIEHPMLVEILIGLAFAHTQQGERLEAERLYQRALHIREQQFGPEHVQVSYPLLGLAHNFTEKREFAQAEQLYQRALHIREQQLGSEHPLVAIALHELAKLYAEQGKLMDAERCFQQALAIREQHLGPQHVVVASTLRGLADLYVQQEKYAQAEPLYQRALAIREQQLGAENALVADPLRGLANLYTRQRKYPGAEPLFQRALRLIEQHFGPEHLETATVLHDFAVFRHVQGKASEAAVLYQRALTIREAVLGQADSRTADTHQRLQGLLDALRQT